jgi:carbon-monoxide dehydrogenase medium subunit
MPMLNMRLAQPAVLLDINRIEQLSGWRSTAEYIELGALVRHRTYEDDIDLRRHMPLLAHAVWNIAHPAVRNRGTIGGSLALADPAAELPALCVCLGARIGLMSVRG